MMKVKQYQCETIAHIVTVSDRLVGSSICTNFRVSQFIVSPKSSCQELAGPPPFLATRVGGEHYYIQLNDVYLFTDNII